MIDVVDDLRDTRLLGDNVPRYLRPFAESTVPSNGAYDATAKLNLGFVLEPDAVEYAAPIGKPEELRLGAKRDGDDSDAELEGGGLLDEEDGEEHGEDQDEDWDGEEDSWDEEDQDEDGESQDSWEDGEGEQFEDEDGTSSGTSSSADSEERRDRRRRRRAAAMP